MAHKLTPSTEDFGSTMMSKPITISDAACMFRHTIRKNDKPYHQEVMKQNNILVDEWYDKVLVKTADSKGTMPCAKVWPSWNIFGEGKEIDAYLDAIDNHLPRATEEQIQYWLDFFRKKSIAELRVIGPATVSTGWQFLTSIIRANIAHQKKEHIYPDGATPLDWEKFANKHPNLVRSKPLPFNLDDDEFGDMLEKVNTIMAIPVKPQAA